MSHSLESRLTGLGNAVKQSDTIAKVVQRAHTPMLGKFEISNYRGFKTYKMDGLGQVNLFVGRNNSGKTAILEGLHFLTSRGDPAVLDDVARRRGERVIRPEQGNPQIVDICHFFHGHSITPDSTFSFSGDNGFPPVSATIIKQKIRATSSESDERQRPVAQGLFLRINVGSKNRNEKDTAETVERDIPVYFIARDGGVEFDISSRYRRARPVERPQSRFVSSDSLTTLDLAAMWDEITVARKEVDVVGALKVIDRNVESVHFLTGVFSQGFYPARGGIVVGLNGVEARLPLGSMGDGMRRMMALATALAFAKGGCLFVDEIDTGLHYSVMSDMWKLVVKNAIDSGVQVFATTHSWDCIEGLSQLCQDDETVLPKVSIHKIDSCVPHSIRFDGKSIVTMVKSDIDPR